MGEQEKLFNAAILDQASAVVLRGRRSINSHVGHARIIIGVLSYRRFRD